MKKARDIHRLLERVNLTVNTDVDREVLGRVMRASRKSTAPVSQADAGSILTETGLWRLTFWRKAGHLAATLLIVSFLVTCLIQSREIADLKYQLKQVQHGVVAIPTDATTTINLYLKEHHNIVTRHASLTPSKARPLQMSVEHSDILYYEIFDNEPDYMRPGIIVRGPSSHQRQINSSEAPPISNGQTLTISEAKEATNFDLVLPTWLHPGYKLSQIRKIKDRNTIQLLYTNGINSVSLFEQSLDGQHGLGPQDFREYAVYCNKGQIGGTILAWRDDVLSYVLVSNVEISKLMELTQSISGGK